MYVCSKDSDEKRRESVSSSDEDYSDSDDDDDNDDFMNSELQNTQECPVSGKMHFHV